MEINTSGAFATAAISSLLGFGLAFFWFDKIKIKTSTKSQRVLLSIASISIGYGLTFTLNEFIGFPLQGLSIRYDKIIGYLIVNVLLLPTIFGILIWLLEPKQFLSEELKESNKLESHDNIKSPPVSMEDAYSQSPATDTKNNKIKANTTKYISMEDAYSNNIPHKNTEKSKLTFNLIEQNRKEELEAIDQDQVWSLAYEEFESENRKIGLWARLFAENNGDDAKAKAAYLKASSEVIHNKLRESLIAKNKEKYQSNKKDAVNKTEEECINDKIYDLYEGSGYQIYVFPNGKAAFKLYKIFENKELAITAISEYRNNGSMGRVGFIREFFT